MKTASSISRIEQSYIDVSTIAFNELKNNEEAIVNLSGEESLFVRFNRSKIRQNIFVEQANVTLQLQSSSQMTRATWPLTGDKEIDSKEMKLMLGRLRAELDQLPADPHLVKLENHGSSHEDKTCHRHDEELIEEIIEQTQTSDMAGLFAGGPVFVGNKNSKGQNHWFSSSNFFFDYSLYHGQKAVKGIYAGQSWDDQSFQNKIYESQNMISLLKKPTREVKPGEYRVYLAPGAVNEMLSLMSWGALSQKAYKSGTCAFQKLADKSKKLSPLIGLRENFDIGWTPKFNSLGEVAENHTPLIEKGDLVQFLTSSKSAMEYKLKANAANETESPRSIEMKTGLLDRDDILRELNTGLYISNLHYLNWSDLSMARFTGMTRYACFWVENGEIVAPIQDLRFDESFFRCWGDELMAITNFSELEPGVSTYYEREHGGKKIPGLLINKWNFTL